LISPAATTPEAVVIQARREILPRSPFDKVFLLDGADPRHNLSFGGPCGQTAPGAGCAAALAARAYAEAINRRRVW